MLAKFYQGCAAVAVVVGLWPADAQADSFVYRDEVYKYTFSYPDSWAMQTPDEPTVRMRVAGPPPEDRASCRVKAEHDGRLEIYPKDLMGKGVEQVFDQKFWESEVGHFDHGKVVEYKPLAGLGAGDATAVKATWFERDADGKMIGMQGLMIGAIYGDTRFVMSCSARADVYARWVELFGSVMGSVVLDERYTLAATGYYRNFLKDPVFQNVPMTPGTPLPADVR